MSWGTGMGPFPVICSACHSDEEGKFSSLLTRHVTILLAVIPPWLGSLTASEVDSDWTCSWDVSLELMLCGSAGMQLSDLNENKV